MSEENERIPEPIKSEEDIPMNREPKTKNLTSQFEQNFKKAEQEHEHLKDNKITEYGFALVACTLGACFVLTILNVFGISGSVLWDDFFTIASSTITLVLGYLFGRKGK